MLMQHLSIFTKQFLGAIPSLEKQDRPKPKTRSKTQSRMYNENVVNIKTQVCDDANMTGNLIAFEPALANVKRSNKVNKILKYVIRIKKCRMR